MGQLRGDGQELVVTEDERGQFVELTELWGDLLKSVSSQVEIGESEKDGGERRSEVKGRGLKGYDIISESTGKH